MEQVLGDLGGFSRQTPDQIRADAPFGQDARAAGGDSEKVARAVPVDPLEGVEDGGDENGAAVVRLDVVDVVGGAGLERHPLVLLVPPADHAAQRAAIPLERFAELRRELAEHRIAVNPSPARRELVLDELAEREALQQRDDIGKALVERGDVGIGVLEVTVMDRVQNRVRHLVRDDVRAQAREDEAAGIVCALRAIGRREVAEEQRRLVGIVVGVGVADRVRVDAQPLHVLARPAHVLHVVRLALGLQHPRIPDDLPAERALEMANRLHRHGVDELLMELRVAFAWRQAVL